MDKQRKKVYDWQNKIVSPVDKSSVDISTAKSIVDYVWMDLGLEYPPQVSEFNSKTALGDATRMQIRLRPSVPTWVVLHEIAHSLTAEPHGKSHQHNSRFVGVYVNLLVRYLHFDMLYIQYSLKEYGVEASYEGHII